MIKHALFVAGAVCLHATCTNLDAASFSLGSINPVVTQETASHFDFTFNGTWTDAQTFSASSADFAFSLSWGEPGPPDATGDRYLDYTFDLETPLGSLHRVFDAGDGSGMAVAFGRFFGESDFIQLRVPSLWTDEATQTIAGDIRIYSGSVPEPSALPIFLGVGALMAWRVRRRRN